MGHDNTSERLGMSPYEQRISKAAHFAVKSLKRFYPESSFGIQINNIDNSEKLEVMVYWAHGKSCRDISPSIATVKNFKVTVGNGNERGEIDDFFLRELRKEIPLKNIRENFCQGS